MNGVCVCAVFLRCRISYPQDMQKIRDWALIYMERQGARTTRHCSGCVRGSCVRSWVYPHCAHRHTRIVHVCARAYIVYRRFVSRSFSYLSACACRIYADSCKDRHIFLLITIALSVCVCVHDCALQKKTPTAHRRSARVTMQNTNVCCPSAECTLLTILHVLVCEPSWMAAETGGCGKKHDDEFSQMLGDEEGECGGFQCHKSNAQEDIPP